VSVKDSMIAATAVATRNRKDFRNASVQVLDPFE
jgi:predicted nucleic acid-binding protein